MLEPAFRRRGRAVTPDRDEDLTLEHWVQARKDCALLIRRHGKTEVAIAWWRRCNAAIERLLAGDDIDREINQVLGDAA